MIRFIIGTSYGIISAFVGMILPVFKIVDIFGHPINVAWGFIYGLGWFLVGFVESVRSPHIALFGSLIWPIIVLILSSYFFGKIWSSYFRYKGTIMSIAIISLFAIVPEWYYLKTPLVYIPVYTMILSSVY